MPNHAFSAVPTNVLVTRLASQVPFVSPRVTVLSVRPRPVLLRFEVLERTSVFKRSRP